MGSVKLVPGLDVICSDTVGFISDLPTELVAAFRATLEEVLTADIILHVRDISHPASDEQARDVEKIITSMGVSETKPVLELWNKVDLLPAEDAQALMTRAERNADIFSLSALSGQGTEKVLEAIAATLNASAEAEELTLDHTDGKRRAWLYAQGVVVSEETRENDSLLSLNWTPKQKSQFAAL